MSETSFCTNVTDVREHNVFDPNPEGTNCPVYAGFFGVMGASFAMVFSGNLERTKKKGERKKKGEQKNKLNEKNKQLVR